MQVDHFPIKGPLLFTPRIFGDIRGYFMETFKANLFEEHAGAGTTFCQDNQSLSKPKGTVRGLHFQTPPHAQGKLVRCIAGSIIDVAVDARRGSPTYGEHVRVLLSAENAAQLWVPAGFLHGFATQEDDTIVAYKCTDYYAPQCDGNILWNDSDLGIDWGLGDSAAIVSDKDRDAPSFKSFVSPF